MLLRTLETLVVLAVLAAGVRADDEVALRNHHILHGQVVASTADSVTFQLGTEGAQPTVISADQILPHSFYTIRRHTIGDDAAQHVELGDFCMENGMFANARHLFNKAKKLDPGRAAALDPKIAAAREGSAAELVEQAKAARAAGRAQQARSRANEVVHNFPDTHAADEARGLASSMHAEAVGKRAADRAERDHRHAEDAMAKVHKTVDRGHALVQKGLQAKNQGQSERAYKQALQEYKRGLHQIDAAAKKYGDDPELAQAIAETRTETVGDIVDAHVNLGAIYLVRRSYQQALGEANQALAVDPDSSSAKSFQLQVENSSSRGWL